MIIEVEYLMITLPVFKAFCQFPSSYIVCSHLLCNLFTNMLKCEHCEMCVSILLHGRIWLTPVLYYNFKVMNER